MEISKEHFENVPITEGVKDNIESVSIVLIGAGNLAVNLGIALFRKGFRIAQVYSRTEASARALAERINTGWTTDLSRVILAADVYIVSLKDSALVELLPQIVKGRPEALFVHTAGSLPLTVWKKHARRYGVLYPLQTFSKERRVDFSEIPFFVEAETAEDTLLLKEIAAKLSGKVYEADSTQRKRLHLAAVFACNFTNHLYALAADILKDNELPFDVLLPLIDETARKVHEISPENAQTGPAVRYDENIIDSHLKMLAKNPSMRRIYELLSESIYIKSYKSEE